jgi:tripartite-type tricarboxylate transporter receptor subunit TctC/ribosomal protein S18 acetylase RimI-like enzyme
VIASEAKQSRINHIAAVVAAILVLPTPAHAQDYPTKPITIVSAQASGGASDTVTRAIQERLQAALGQPIVIENRPGASGNVGAAAVARSAPDGYTLMVGTDAMMTSNVHLFRSMAFDPVKDFAPITNAGANIITLAVNSAVPANSAAELIAYAKSKAGSLKFGSSGIASPHHLAGELLKQKTGIDIVHVPYRGGALSANDLVGGHIEMAFLSYSSAAPLVPTGKIRILAVVERTRYSAIPDIPTVAETVPGFEMSSWLGFFAPAGAPAPIVARLNRELVQILQVEAVKERLGTLGLAVIAPFSLLFTHSRPPVQPLDFYEAKHGDFLISVVEGGNLEAVNEVSIRSEVEGTARIIFIVPEGSYVKKDALLVELDSSSSEDAVNLQQINVEKAQFALVQTEQQLEIQKSVVESEIAAATLADREWAAELMASTEPWTRLGITLDVCRRACCDPEYLVFIARIGEKRQGFIVLQARGVAGAPYVKTLAVTADRRSGGVGAKLLAFAEDYFRGRSRHLFMCVSSFNTRARSLYERLGYVQVGEFPAHVVADASEILLYKRLE